MMKWEQLNLQDYNSPIMMLMSNLHDTTLIILILIMTFITLSMMSIMRNKLTSRYITENHEIETIWTILPTLVLIFLAFPSLRLLYLMDETNYSELTLKTIGHQWYWSYEYSDFNDIEFDSYMLNTQDLKIGQHRLLEVDNRIVLPTNMNIRVLTTSADVIHAWTIPALGVKMDAIPGRLNQSNFSIMIPSILYGQCSEICGANHSFMPISIEAMPNTHFMKWLNNMYATP